MVETCEPIEISIPSLDTLGPTFGKSLPTFTAHPKLDYETKEIFGIVYNAESTENYFARFISITKDKKISKNIPIHLRKNLPFFSIYLLFFKFIYLFKQLNQ